MVWCTPVHEKISLEYPFSWTEFSLLQLAQGLRTQVRASPWAIILHSFGAKNFRKIQIQVEDLGRAPLTKCLVSQMSYHDFSLPSQFFEKLFDITQS